MVATTRTAARHDATMLFPRMSKIRSRPGERGGNDRRAADTASTAQRPGNLRWFPGRALADRVSW
ncbi:hypothetical protein GCM10010532_021600 [Dactylosporangium siamense]|uniref:Uncharacterized protein n=1 Tax=Dactylosporangium siamense TaxID=685454 RepID=A0A919U5J9_9ACTN|nr:hypothetical protein Dsi01nite_014000 [Dactylosporangium siamense]